jgi:hypothetical protein
MIHLNTQTDVEQLVDYLRAIIDWNREDLNIQRSIVIRRVPLLVRSAGIKLLLERFVLL